LFGAHFVLQHFQVHLIEDLYSNSPSSRSSSPKSSLSKKSQNHKNSKNRKDTHKNSATKIMQKYS
jgi:hypothetical protein